MNSWYPVALAQSYRRQEFVIIRGSSSSDSDLGTLSLNLTPQLFCRYSRPKEYIVTQNPLTNTRGDFWRMIFEQRIVYIICLCDGDPDNPVSNSQSELVIMIT